MDVRDYLSDDGQALLALCSQLALPEEASTAGPAPFKLSEWTQLARQIEVSPWKRLAALRDQSAAELAKGLGIPLDDAERIVHLFGRAGRLALALDDLFSRGMWAVTRLDEQYPAKLRDSLKHQAPTVLF